MAHDRKAEKDFEDEVRRIARAKWPSAQYGGAALLDGRERDGIFETEESVHFLEATVSGGADKARDDTRKMFKAISDHNRKGTLQTAQGWFVTKSEPSADQRKEVAEQGKGQVRAVSFAQFQQSLIDVRAYLAAREDHRFGSVKDFASEEKAPKVPFVDIGFTAPKTGKSLLIDDVLHELQEGRQIAIVGQYGAGKSMTLRELFFRLKRQYIEGKTAKFPVYINLREHSGQRDPVELLVRHARNIGFGSPNSLIRAWRAGFVILLVDGFDEVASLGVQGSWKKLKDLRMRSLEGVRGLLRDSVGMGVVVSGRSSYFGEDYRELCTALGLSFSNATLLSVDAFTDEQVRTFLSKFSTSAQVDIFPDWLPTRPLLLGYLASKGLLEDFNAERARMDVVDGWDYLLDRIYSREEEIETNLDGGTLRLILERAATFARSSADGLGPITRSEMFAIFSEVCGYEPDEQGVLALQRLPGLGIYRAEEESRCFVDRELAAVCSGRELQRFLESPYEMDRSKIWRELMSNCASVIDDIGSDFAFRKLSAKPDVRGSVRQAISWVNAKSGFSCVRGDLASIVIRGGLPLDVSLNVSEMDFSSSALEFHKSAGDFGRITFSHCIFGQLVIDADIDSACIPSFEDCVIAQVSGRVSAADLPANRFVRCEYSAFDAIETAEAIRSAPLSVGEKVLLVTLRKLFVQGLSGRAESAVFRGLDVDERRCVPDILKLLKRHQLATEYSRGDGVVWMPVRRELDRVKRILTAPSECGELIIQEAKAVS